MQLLFPSDMRLMRGLFLRATSTLTVGQWIAIKVARPFSPAVDAFYMPYLQLFRESLPLIEGTSQLRSQAHTHDVKSATACVQSRL